MTETEKIQQLTKVGKGVATAIVCPPPISPEDMRNLREVAVSYRGRMAATQTEGSTIRKAQPLSLSLSPQDVSGCASALTAASSSRQLA